MPTTATIALEALDDDLSPSAIVLLLKKYRGNDLRPVD
jgi:hypothetical protein